MALLQNWLQAANPSALKDEDTQYAEEASRLFLIELSKEGARKQDDVRREVRKQTKWTGQIVKAASGSMLALESYDKSGLLSLAEGKGLLRELIPVAPVSRQPHRILVAKAIISGAGDKTGDLFTGSDAAKKLARAYFGTIACHPDFADGFKVIEELSSNSTKVMAQGPADNARHRIRQLVTSRVNGITMTMQDVVDVLDLSSRSAGSSSLSQAKHFTSTVRIKQIASIQLVLFQMAREMNVNFTTATTLMHQAAPDVAGLENWLASDGSYKVRKTMKFRGFLADQGNSDAFFNLFYQYRDTLPTPSQKKAFGAIPLDGNKQDLVVAKTMGDFIKAARADFKLEASPRLIEHETQVALIDARTSKREDQPANSMTLFEKVANNIYLGMNASQICVKCDIDYPRFSQILTCYGNTIRRLISAKPPSNVKTLLGTERKHAALSDSEEEDAE